MTEQIQVVGLTTTDVLNGVPYKIKVELKANIRQGTKRSYGVSIGVQVGTFGW